MDIAAKRIQEKDTVEKMIKIYCRQIHGYHHELCHDCQELLGYAFIRIDKCPIMETKTFCSMCKTHCFSPEMRVRIKLIMKYSGRRMVLYHPLLAIKHLWATLLKKHSKS